MSVVSASLHDVRGDARVRIRTILFDQIREACAGQGVRAGQTVRVRRSGRAVLLELPRGGTVRLAPEWARFIEVELREPALRRRTPARLCPGRRP